MKNRKGYLQRTIVELENNKDALVKAMYAARLVRPSLELGPTFFAGKTRT
jgi:hypothetical protein